MEIGRGLVKVYSGRWKVYRDKCRGTEIYYIKVWNWQLIKTKWIKEKINCSKRIYFSYKQKEIKGRRYWHEI